MDKETSSAVPAEAIDVVAPDPVVSHFRQAAWEAWQNPTEISSTLHGPTLEDLLPTRSVVEVFRERAYQGWQSPERTAEIFAEARRRRHARLGGEPEPIPESSRGLTSEEVQAIINSPSANEIAEEFAEARRRRHGRWGQKNSSSQK